MNPLVLIELAKRWEEDAKPPEVVAEDDLHADVARRASLLECARDLRALLRLLGGAQ